MDDKKSSHISGKNEFIDMFDREDGELGNGWIDAYNEHPKWWDQFKLLDGVPITPDPDTGRIAQPENSGARAAFYREFGSDFKSNISFFAYASWYKFTIGRFNRLISFVSTKFLSYYSSTTFWLLKFLYSNCLSFIYVDGCYFS